MRAPLYMATLSAIKRDPAIKIFYERLRKAAKAAKVALMACMHKLLIILNAILRSGIAWRGGLQNA